MTNLPWLLRMAWHDSRRSRARRALFRSSMVPGSTALVGINSCGDNLAQSVRGGKVVAEQLSAWPPALKPSTRISDTFQTPRAKPDGGG